MQQIVIALLLLGMHTSVQAYIGPGLGAGVIGVILGLLASIGLALVAVFWYPLKRAYKKLVGGGLKLAEEAHEKAPKSAAIMDTLGWILVRKGRVDDGAKFLEKASELAPDQGDIAYHHAVALNKSGRTSDARRKLRKLIGSGLKFSELEKAEALLKELGG